TPRRLRAPTLFPYPTLFRSHHPARPEIDQRASFEGSRRQRLGVEAPGHAAQARFEVGVGRWEVVRDEFDRARPELLAEEPVAEIDRKSTRLNSSHVKISYAV